MTEPGLDPRDEREEIAARDASDASDAPDAPDAPGGLAAPLAPGPRVAVVAVHGVADQAPGATVHALAALLTARPPRDVHYRDGSCDCLLLRVPVLEGCVPAVRRGPASRRRGWGCSCP